MAKRDDEDEGEIRETPPHARGTTKSEVDDEGDRRQKPPRRIDDPDQPQAKANTVDVDGQSVEIVDEAIEDLDTRAKDDADDGKGDDEEGAEESRSKKRRRDRNRGKDLDRQERARLLETVNSLQQTVTRLAEGQRATIEHTEETTLANTRAAINSVMTQRAAAFADGDMAKVNELDEAVYRLRRQRDDLEDTIERRAKEPKERGTGGGGAGTAGAATRGYSEPELRTIRGFIRKEIPWFDPNDRRDPDVQAALDISAEMGDEGWRPSDPDWAEEMKDRLQEAIPHRFEDRDDGDRRRHTRKAPPVGGRGREGGAGGGSKRQFRLTPLHKQALAESGHEPGTPEYNAILATWIKDAGAARERR